MPGGALNELVSSAWTTFTTPPKCAVSAREKRILAQARWFSLPHVGRRLDPKSLSIEAYEWGSAAPGDATVVLVHGWGGCAAQFAAFIRPITDTGLCVVAFDSPAHGRSPGERTNIYELAAGLEAIAERYGPVHAIVGHSLGGAAAMMVLSRGVPAERVALIAPSPRLYDEVSKFAAHFDLPPDVEGGVRRHMESCFSARIWDETTLAGLAPRIPMPVLIAHDRNDPKVSHADSVEIAEALPDGRLFSTTGLGHLATLRTKAIIATVAEHVAG